jgi:hypothetical protein
LQTRVHDCPKELGWSKDRLRSAEQKYTIVIPSLTEFEDLAFGSNLGMKEEKWLRIGAKRLCFDWIEFWERESHPFIQMIAFHWQIVQFKELQQLKGNDSADGMRFVQSGFQSLQSD